MTVTLPEFSESISISDWINEALSSIQEDVSVSDYSLNSPLEIKLTHLQSKLDTIQQTLSTQIHQLSHDILQNVSKTQQDLDGLKKNMNQLKTTARSVLGHSVSNTHNNTTTAVNATQDTNIASASSRQRTIYIFTESSSTSNNNNERSKNENREIVPEKENDSLSSHLKSRNIKHDDEEFGSNFEYLVKLNKLRINMEETRKILRASERWYLLPSDLEIMLSSNDFDGAAHRLYEAKQLLSHQPPQQRVAKDKIIQEWQNKLESSLTSSVVQAIQSGDKAQISRMYQTFTKIDKAAEFLSFYNNLISKQFVKLFDDDFALDCVFSVAPLSNNKNNNNNSQVSSNIHASFVEKFESLLMTEVFPLIQTNLKTAQSVFPNPHQAFHNVLGHVMDVMSVKLTKKLESISLSSLSKQDIQSKIMAAYTIVLKFCYVTETLLMSEPSFDAQLLSSKNAWGVLLCQPFLPFQETFIEEMVVKSQELMTTVFTFSIQDDEHDWISVIEDRMPSVFRHFDALLIQCRSFTGFMTLGGWVKSVEYIFIRYMKALNKLASDLEQKSMKSSLENEWNIFQTGLGVLALFMLFQDSKDQWLASIEKTYQTGCARIRFIGRFGTSNSATSDATVSFTNKANTDTSNHVSAFYNNLSLGNNSSYVNPEDTGISFAAALRLSKLNTKALQAIVMDSDLRKTLSPILDNLNKSILRVQKTVFGILYGYMNNLINQLQNSRVYGQEQQQNNNSNNSSSSNAYNLNVPQFSLSPSTICSKIGEYLLTLPQNLDMFADHPAISYSLQTLPGWTIEEFMALKKEMLEDAYDQNQGLYEAAPYFWLIAVANCAMKDLLKVLLMEKDVSQLGLKQMVTDIAYLLNVISAMELDPLPRLQNLLQLLESDDLDSVIQSASANDTSLVEDSQHRPQDSKMIEELVSTVKRWKKLA